MDYDDFEKLERERRRQRFARFERLFNDEMRKCGDGRTIESSSALGDDIRRLFSAGGKTNG
jgi:hypothetical protein